MRKVKTDLAEIRSKEMFCFMTLFFPGDFTFGVQWFYLYLVIFYWNSFEDVSKISTNKLSTSDFFNFYFTTRFNPKQGPLQVSLYFEIA